MNTDKQVNPNDADSAQNNPEVMPPGTKGGEDPKPKGPDKKPRKTKKKTKQA